MVQLFHRRQRNMNKMTPKTSLMLIAFGLACLLQPTPSDATNSHALELRQTFRGIKYDESRKSIFLHSAKYGVQTQLRDPLMKKALAYKQGEKLSERCLKQMVAKVHDVTETFYAGFSYACETPDQYTEVCLEAAKPSFLEALVKIREQTEGCLSTTCN